MEEKLKRRRKPILERIKNILKKLGTVASILAVFCGITGITVVGVVNFFLAHPLKNSVKPEKSVIALEHELPGKLFAADRKDTEKKFLVSGTREDIKPDFMSMVITESDINDSEDFINENLEEIINIIELHRSRKSDKYFYYPSNIKIEVQEEACIARRCANKDQVLPLGGAAIPGAKVILFDATTDAVIETYQTDEIGAVDLRLEDGNYYDVILVPGHHPQVSGEYVVCSKETFSSQITLNSTFNSEEDEYWEPFKILLCDKAGDPITYQSEFEICNNKGDQFGYPCETNGDGVLCASYSYDEGEEVGRAELEELEFVLNTRYPLYLLRLNEMFRVQVRPNAEGGVVYVTYP